MFGLGLSIPEIAVRARGSQYAGYSLALDFKNGLYRSGSTLKSDITQLPGYSYARTGAKYELDASGSPLAFAANVPGIVPGVGYWARAAITNPILNNCAFTNASWTRRGTFAAVDNNTTAPDGTMTASLFTGVAASGTGDIYDTASTTTPSRFPNSTVCTPSIWVKKVSNTGTLSIGSPFGSANGLWTVNLSLLGAGWERLTATHAAVTIRNAWVSTATGQNGLNIFCSAGSPISFYTWGAQLVTGSLPGPIIVTTSAAATVALDNMQLSQPMPIDEDWIIYATVNYQAAPPTAGDLPFCFSDGTASNSEATYHPASGTLGALHSNGGATITPGSSVSQTVAGRAALLLRRRGGKYAAAAKNSAGTIGVGADGATTAFATGLNRFDIGNQLGLYYVNAPIEFIGYKRGTFSDADLTALLTAA
jgi:hypothetical protein